jgi:hypothetical protein
MRVNKVNVSGPVAHGPVAQVHGIETSQHAPNQAKEVAVRIYGTNIFVRLSDGALLVERIAAKHQSADRAAAENRKPHAGAAKRAHFHERLHDRSSAPFRSTEHRSVAEFHQAMRPIGREPTSQLDSVSFGIAMPIMHGHNVCVE